MHVTVKAVHDVCLQISNYTIILVMFGDFCGGSVLLPITVVVSLCILGALLSNSPIIAVALCVVTNLH
jgi:hypothetical protein